MDKIQWNESLAFGIGLIDQQHKEWIKHYNSVVDALSSHKGAAQVAKTLSYLLDYSEIHFLTEEKSMLENKYPYFEEHREEHEKLCGTISTLVNEYREEGPTNILTHSIETLMNNWLTTHIQEIDTKFINFVKEKKIEISE